MGDMKAGAAAWRGATCVTVDDIAAVCGVISIGVVSGWGKKTWTEMLSEKE